MKRVVVLLLLATISISFAMEKPAIAGKMPASQNSLLVVTDDNLSRILLSGSKDDLRKMLDSHLILPTRIFFNKLFKDKSLLQATLELQLNPINTTGRENRYEIARLLLDKGADTRDLNEFLLPAIKNADVKLLQLLLDYGVKDSDGKALKWATEMENDPQFPAVRKKKLAEIKKLLTLKDRESLLLPIARKASKSVINTQLPVVELPQAGFSKALSSVPSSEKK